MFHSDFLYFGHIDFIFLRNPNLPVVEVVSLNNALRPWYHLPNRVTSEKVIPCHCHTPDEWSQVCAFTIESEDPLLAAAAAAAIFWNNPW
jgi:hypothetical protein